MMRRFFKKKLAVSASFFLLGLLRLWAEPPNPSWQWASPVQMGVAVCSKFSWVSNLPFGTETSRLLKRATMDGLGLSQEQIDLWENGSAGEFVAWLKTLGKKGDAKTTLILYFSTHQLRDGHLKFSNGPDLSPEAFIKILNEIAESYQRILLIHDCCYAAALEKSGGFSDKIIRLYSANDREEALDLDFDKGPYGLDDFVKMDRVFLQSQWQWNPRGMSFIGILGLKAGRAILDSPIDSMDLELFLHEMNRFRKVYDQEIRQARPQNILLVPPNANFTILTRIKH